MKTILDLCGGTGAWSAPYKAAGYDVWIITLPEWDVRDFARELELKARGKPSLLKDMPLKVHGILCAPPCDHFAAIGARYWKAKDMDGRTDEAVAVVNACMAIVRYTRPEWWALENPKGRIQKLCSLGNARLSFQPCDYGDPWTKRTILWGRFNPPAHAPVKSKGMHPALLKSGDGKTAKCDRSITPPGFARAFFEANP